MNSKNIFCIFGRHLIFEKGISKLLVIDGISTLTKSNFFYSICNKILIRRIELSELHFELYFAHANFLNLAKNSTSTSVLDLRYVREEMCRLSEQNSELDN